MMRKHYFETCRCHRCRRRCRRRRRHCHSHRDSLKKSIKFERLVSEP